MFTSNTPPRDHPHRALQAFADMPTGDPAPDHPTQRNPSDDEEPNNPSNHHDGTSPVRRPLQSPHPHKKNYQVQLNTAPGADNPCNPDTLSRYMRYTHRHHKTQENPSPNNLCVAPLDLPVAPIARNPRPTSMYDLVTYETHISASPRKTREKHRPGKTRETFHL